MEPTESTYSPSPDTELTHDSPTRDYVENPTHVKFLVSNAAAGCVIGKGGTTISDIQSQSGAKILLSRYFEVFPGTSDRILMVSGGIKDVLNAVNLVLARLLSDLYKEEGDHFEPIMQARLIVPNGCCGGLIGKRGSIIKSFVDESQAGIKVSPPDTNFYGLSDRLVTIVGTLDEQMMAFDLILSWLSEDPHYQQNVHAPFSYSVFFNSTASYSSIDYRSNGTGGKFQNNKEEGRTNSVTIGIADEHMGLVLGRGGKNVATISQISGARIQVSNRGDFLSGTTSRKVTITGSPTAVRVAENMIMKKVATASEKSTD